MNNGSRRQSTGGYLGRGNHHHRSPLAETMMVSSSSGGNMPKSQNAFEEAKNIFNRTRQEISRKKAIGRKLKHKLEERNRQYDELCRNLDKLKLECAELEDSLCSMEPKMDRQQETATKLNQVLTNQSKVLKNFDETIDKLQYDLQDGMDKMAEPTQLLENLSIEAEAVRKGVLHYVSMEQKLQQRLHVLDNHLTSIQVRNNTLKDTSRECQARAELCKSAEREWTERVGIVRKEIEFLQTKIQTYSRPTVEALSMQQTQIDKQGALLEKLTQLSDKKYKLKLYTDHIKQLETIYVAHMNNMSQLQQQFDAKLDAHRKRLTERRDDLKRKLSERERKAEEEKAKQDKEEKAMQHEERLEAANTTLTTLTTTPKSKPRTRARITFRQEDDDRSDSDGVLISPNKLVQLDYHQTQTKMKYGIIPKRPGHQMIVRKPPNSSFTTQEPGDPPPAKAKSSKHKRRRTRKPPAQSNHSLNLFDDDL